MTAKTLPGALAAASLDDIRQRETGALRAAQEAVAAARAEGWRDGYAAGLEAAAKWCERGEGAVWEESARHIRSLEIPEMPR